MSPSDLATLVLRADALANAALAAGIVALGGRLTDAAGLASGWSLTGLAVLLLVNGVLCWRAGRGVSPSRRALRGLADVDIVFTAGVLWFVVANPTGAEPWLRTVLIGLVVVVATVAATKLLLANRLTLTARTS